MEKSEKSGGKRNNKNQKNKQKLEENKANVHLKDETINEHVTKVIKEPEPQPQRAIRRNRPEVTNSVASKAASAQTISESKSEPKVEVDHSNLKRETEEIAKLTKKFTKREISSNWHRYSAPENAEDDKAVEYGAPADFSDLIQISASRGGHLQLKEEQDWSSVSGAELSGYFALDLKMLNRGLACIPAHERLRIPSHVLTEDDVEKFNDEAKKATTYYNTEFYNVKDQTLKCLTSLIKSDENNEENDTCETVTTKTTERFNILDLETSRKILLDLTLDPAISFEDPQKENNVSSGGIVLKQFDSDIAKQDDVTLALEEPKPFSKESNDRQLNSKDFSNLNSSAKDLQTHINQSSKTDKENNVDHNMKLPNESKVKEPNSYNDKQSLKDVSSVSVSTEGLRKEAKPSNPTLSLNTIIQKTEVKKNLEDDDDLDFLLSLKAPMEIQKPVTEPSSAPVREVSIVPSGTKVVQPTSNTTNMDLDDWLDSVLQD